MKKPLERTEITNMKAKLPCIHMHTKSTLFFSFPLERNFDMQARSHLCITNPLIWTIKKPQQLCCVPKLNSASELFWLVIFANHHYQSRTQFIKIDQQSVMQHLASLQHAERNTLPCWREKVFTGNYSCCIQSQWASAFGFLNSLCLPEVRYYLKIKIILHI